ncbi:hypothetical protein vseg_012705 [Gypsophila vaccaria]
MQGPSRFSTELSVPIFPSPPFTSSSTDIESSGKHHEVSDTRGRVWKHMVFSITFIIPMLMLISIACYGYKLATTTKYIEIDSSEDSYMTLMFGIFTVVFGLMYLSFGLIIVAELALDLVAWFRREEGKTSENEEEEQMTRCQMIVNTVAIIASMIMLTWAIYNGYKLAAEAQEVVIYSRFPFLIGVICMGFGFIYFIYGIRILAESAYHLPGRLHQAVTKYEALLERKGEVNLEEV